MSKVRKVILVLLAVLALMVIGAYAFLQAQLNKINRLSAVETEFTTEDFDEDTDEPDTITDVDWGEILNRPEEVHGVVNVLLVGQDTRVAGQRARSDSMIILSMDTTRKKLSMVSLMRDLYVQIPGYSDNKINAAYAFGGFELLDKTIEANFGIHIDYNVEVDFDGFIHIIDALGGIDIRLNEAEVSYMSGTSQYSDYSLQDPIDGLSVGYNHLSGEAALMYARIRYVRTDNSHDDFGRTERQRIVIQTIFQQVKTRPWTDLLNLYNSVAGDITTDMTNDEILSIGLTAYNIGADSISEYRIPEDGSYSGQRVKGMSVLVPNDWNVLRANLQEFVYG